MEYLTLSLSSSPRLNGDPQTGRNSGKCFAAVNAGRGADTSEMFATTTQLS